MTQMRQAMHQTLDLSLLCPQARLELLRHLKEVQKQEQEREERVQRILRPEVGDARTPAAARLVDGRQRDARHADEHTPLSPSQLRSRRKRAQRVPQQEQGNSQEGSQQDQLADSPREPHIVEVEVNWSDTNSTSHAEL